jgi:hypothetical protein
MHQLGGKYQRPYIWLLSVFLLDHAGGFVDRQNGALGIIMSIGAKLLGN